MNAGGTTVNTARPRRPVALFIVLFLHGLIFLGGFCALGVFATFALLSPESEMNRLHRAPTRGEAARGEVWFSGHIQELALSKSVDVASGVDPWGGCSIRRQVYRSGKNAGWYDDTSPYSFGAARVVSDEKRGSSDAGPATVDVPLHLLDHGARTILTDDQALAMMSSATRSPSHRWVRDCFGTGWGVTVDGKLANEELAPIMGRVAARVETRDVRVSRLHTEAMWCSLGPLAWAGALVWLALFLAAVRAPGHVSSMFRTTFASSTRVSPLVIAAPSVGLAFGLFSLLATFHSVALLVVYPIAFSAFALLVHQYTRGVSLRRGLVAMLGGAEVSGVAATCGKIALPDGAPPETLPVVATEVFPMSQKGALGKKVHTHVEPETFVVRDGDAVSTCDSSSCDFFGESRQQSEGGHDVRRSSYGAPELTGNRYAVRVTTLGEETDVVVAGPVAKGADSRAATADDYRGSGTARFFRRDGAARVVVFQGTREELRAYIATDLGTLRVYRVLLALWFAFACFSIALAVKYTHSW